MSLFSYQTPSEAVTRFYEALHRKDFDTAWNCLTTEIQQEVWKDTLYKTGRRHFEEGYVLTTGITEITCTMLTPTTPDSTEAKCHLQYRDAKNILVHPLMENLDAQDKDSLESIQKFKDFMIEELGANADKTLAIEPERAYQANAVEVFLWLGDVFYPDHARHFSTLPYEEVTAREITCTRQEDAGWLIHSIKRAPVKQ